MIKVLEWIGLYVAGRIGLYFVDTVVINMTKKYPKLKSKETLKPLTKKDYTYLFANSVTETIFIKQLLNIVSSKPFLTFKIFKTTFCFYGLFYLDDIGYLILHKFLHDYYWFHKDHHEIKIPSRGYIDAGNEHPLEMILALLYNYSVIIIFNYIIDIPTISILLYVFAKAIGSCINHLNRSINIDLGFGVRFDSKFHQDHHIYNKCNYSQFCQFLDNCI